MPCFFSKVQLFHNSACKPPPAEGRLNGKKEGGVSGRWAAGKADGVFKSQFAPRLFCPKFVGTKKSSTWKIQ